MIGPGDTTCWNLNPHFDEVAQQINPTKVYERLGKRDSMHFNNTEETIAATSLMIFDAVRWTCMASAIRAEVEQLIHALRASGIPPARSS